MRRLCLRHTWIHERRGIHVLLVMSELRSVRILLCVGIGDGLIKRTPHGDMVGKIGRQSSVKVCRTCLEVRRESPILHGEVVVFLFVHFFVDNILLSNAQGATSTSLVNFRCSSCRLNPSLETSITSPGSSDVSSIQLSADGRQAPVVADIPLLVFFVRPLGLEHLRRRNGSLSRHSADAVMLGRKLMGSRRAITS